MAEQVYKRDLEILLRFRDVNKMDMNKDDLR